ncbi:MAG: MarR family winged helix-turn-helix transcriptional regulator [Ruminococcus sp.]|jgi:DNA-binding MarR family transcriptional regulator
MEKSEYTIAAFNKLYKELDDIYHDLARNIGVSDSAFCIFYLIRELGDGCLQRDICRESYISKQTINSSIRKLERDGYLYLSQGKGHDKHIHLTPIGQKFVRENILPVYEMEREAFQFLDEAERKMLLRLLKKYIVRLQILEKEQFSHQKEGTL